MTTTNNLEARVFITDWASYNDGSQFEFGKWWDLEDFSDYEEFSDTVTEYFKEADEKSPLYFTTREEIFFSDHEDNANGFLTEDFSSAKKYFELKELDEHDLISQLIAEESNCEAERVYYTEGSQYNNSDLAEFHEQHTGVCPYDLQEKSEYLRFNFDAYRQQEIESIKLFGTDYIYTIVS